MIKNEEDGNVGRNDFNSSVKTYYQDLRKYSPISKEEERRLMFLAKSGDIEARNKIVTANLRFVFDIAKKYRGNGVDIAELISEGNKAVLKAIDKFDMTKDVKFFTYAVWWIRQHMMAAIEERMNESMNEVSFDDNFNDNNRGLENMSGEYEDDDNCIDWRDISDSTGIEYDKIEEETQKQFVVQKLLASLNRKERAVIMKYFGIDSEEDGKNLEEISNEMNISTERVRQIKAKAINTMRAEVFNIKEASFLFRNA